MQPFELSFAFATTWPGLVVRLSDVLGAYKRFEKRFARLEIRAHTGNSTSVVYVGGSGVLSDGTGGGVPLLIAGAPLVYGPFDGGWAQFIDTDSIYVAGANALKIVVSGLVEKIAPAVAYTVFARNSVTLAPISGASVTVIDEWGTSVNHSTAADGRASFVLAGAQRQGKVNIAATKALYNAFADVTQYAFDGTTLVIDMVLT